jgi:hypothetical protein
MVEVEMFKSSMRLRRGSKVLSPFYYESAPSPLRVERKALRAFKE